MCFSFSVKTEQGQRLPRMLVKKQLAQRDKRRLRTATVSGICESKLSWLGHVTHVRAEQNELKESVVNHVRTSPALHVALSRLEAKATDMFVCSHDKMHEEEKGQRRMQQS